MGSFKLTVKLWIQRRLIDKAFPQWTLKKTIYSGSMIRYLLLLFTPGGRHSTISKSLNQTTHSQWFVKWFFSHYTFHHRYAKHNREGGRKNKRKNTDLGQLQAQERESVTLYILCAFVDSRGCVFCAKLLQSHQQCWHFHALVHPASVGQRVLAVAFLTSIDSLLCSASIYSMPPSADWLSRSSHGPSFPSLLRVSREISPSVLCVGFAPK